jgi:hypothetical protein
MEAHENAKDFIIPLPFQYKKAVLTQARSRWGDPYAFIVELSDGSRKFMKGPFKNAEMAKGHVICNDVKRKLQSPYIHAIQCEVKHCCFGDCCLNLPHLAR